MSTLDKENDQPLLSATLSTLQSSKEQQPSSEKWVLPYKQQLHIDTDPESRDSGISVNVNSRSQTPQKVFNLFSESSDRILGSNLDPESSLFAENCNSCPAQFDENYDSFDCNTELAAYGPSHKRRKHSYNFEEQQNSMRKPRTDFSFLKISQGKSGEDKNGESFEIGAPKIAAPLKVLRTPSPNNSYELQHHSLLTNDELIPQTARSIHRVHSSSVLEYSSRALGSPEELDDNNYSLRAVERPQKPHRAYRSIHSDTLAALLNSMNEEQFLKRFSLVDCRYPYEYNGGHIRYAINVHEPSSIGDIFFPMDEQKLDEMKTKIPIFYCEYSQKRGPSMALALRNFDRNRHEYPYIEYKEIYILDRGFNHFFKETKHITLCEPPTYVSMIDSNYVDELKKYTLHRKGRVTKRRFEPSRPLQDSNGRS